MRIGTVALIGAALAATAVAGGEAEAQAVAFSLDIMGANAGYIDVESSAGGELSLGIGMGSPMYEWIKLSFAGQGEPRDGSIVAGAPGLGATSRRSFEGAWVSGVGFTALDAASKDAMKLNVALHADLGPSEPASGPFPQPPAGASDGLVRGFRLDIGGLPCEQTVGVGAINATITAAGPRASNLVFFVPPAQAKPFYDWKAASATTPPKSAALDYLNGSNGVVAALRMSGLVPVSVTPVPGSTPARVRVEASSSAAWFDAR